MDLRSQTEQALVGTVIAAPDSFVKICDIVKPEDFHDQAARQVYLAALGMWKSRKTVDLVTVATEMPQMAGWIAEAHGKGFAPGAKDYAAQVSMAAKERRISDTLNRILTSKEPIETRLSDIMSLYQQEVFVTGKAPELDAVMKRFREHVSANRRRGYMGIPTGFTFLEENHTQYVAGHIWTMGAYTSVGKTAVMVQKIVNLLTMEPCPSVIVISTEMTEQQIVARIIANITGIHSFRILSGHYRHGEEEQVVNCEQMLRGKPVRIYDDVYELGNIEAVFRKADLQGGVDLGFIDYVQNCIVPEAKSEYQAGALLSKRLQKMAKDVSCCLICLSQVSNDVGRGNTEQLEYKGAGEWAAVSDIGVYLQRHKTEKYRLKYAIKKNRHGALLEQELEYMSDYTRIESR